MSRKAYVPNLGKTASLSGLRAAPRLDTPSTRPLEYEASPILVWSQKMKRIRRFALPLLFLIPAASAIALPDLLTAYKEDPMAKKKDADCTLCHEAPQDRK